MIGLITVCVVLMFVELVVEKVSYGLIISAVNLVMWGYKGIKLRDKHYLLIAALFVFVSVTICVSYFIDLFTQYE